MEEMDPSMLLILSNLLNLHSNMDPTSFSSYSSPMDTAFSSSSAPLLFFALTSILSYASTVLTQKSSRAPTPPPPPPPPRAPPSPAESNFLLSLSSDRIWSMDPAARDAKWRSQYGLSYPGFATLLDHLRPHLSLSHLPVPTDHALSIALCRLSRGVSSKTLARSLSLPPTLISRATNAVTRLLSTRLYPDYVKTPISHRLLQTINSFKDLTSLPNCSGFIASSPVRVRLSSDSDDYESFLSPNRAFPSILLQVVSDHRKVFWDACVRAPGSSDSASHFRDSNLYERLTTSKILRDSTGSVRGHQVRPYIVGDSSYPLLPFLITPFSCGGGPNNSASNTGAHEAFDAAVSKGRAASVDTAIALLKGRWKILRNLNVGLDHAAQTIVACVVLHNMCQIAGEPEDDEKLLWRDLPESVQQAEPVENENSLHYAGEILRQALADDVYETQQRQSR